jgi:Ca2+:H+ antiporter
MGSTSSLPLLLGRSRSSFDYSYNHTSCSVNPELVGRTASVVLLVLSSLLVAVCAEFLVNTIDVMVIHSGLSEALIGLIILPIAGNCAEHITAVTVASKNKLDLAIGVSVGSSIQIALFVSPLVVVLGWLLDRDMNFHFSLFETVTLVASTFLVNFLLLNGKTNFLEGSLLCACYFIIGSVYSLRYLRTC